MKRLIALSIILLTIPLLANVRGPIIERGSVSSNISPRGEKIIFQQEDMIIKMPLVNQKKQSSPAIVSVIYTLTNQSENILKIPVKFSALGVNNITINVNKKNILYNKKFNQQVINEYLVMLLKTRYDNRDKHILFYYRLGYYDSYFKNYEKKRISKFYNGNKDDYKLFSTKLKTNGKQIYRSLIRHNRVQDFSSLEFILPLKKGKNSLIIQYKQTLNFNEYSAGSYFHSGINLETSK